MQEAERKHWVVKDNNDKQTEKRRENRVWWVKVLVGGEGGVRDSRHGEMEASCAFA